MSIELIKEAVGKIVLVHFMGRLTKEDYERFAAEVEKLIKQYIKIDILLRMDGLQGWDAAALWEDIKFDKKNFAQVGKLAMIGDAKWDAMAGDVRWERWMSTFCRPFTKARVKYFDKDQADLAEVWLRNRKH